MHYIEEDGTFVLSFHPSLSVAEIVLAFRAAVEEQSSLNVTYLTQHLHLPLDFFEEQLVWAIFIMYAEGKNGIDRTVGSSTCCVKYQYTVPQKVFFVATHSSLTLRNKCEKRGSLFYIE
jgi:hypothetical protein